MRILIIDDNEYKYQQIKDSLDRICNPWITWCKSRNSGLVSILKHNIKKEFEPYDLVIIDNILPIDDDENDLKPRANDIVNEIRRRGLEDLPLVVCSSEEVEECDCNYFIKYDSSVSLDETFKTILSDLAVYQIIQESQTVSSKYSKLTEACEQYPEIQLVPNGRAYQVFDETTRTDRFIESFIGKSQEQGPVKKLVPKNNNMI